MLTIDLSKKQKLKNSTNFFILNSILENNIKTSSTTIIQTCKKINCLFYLNTFNTLLLRNTANCVFKDMLGLIVMWRHIRGYPVTGATTHTNAKTSKKNKILLLFRLNQFNNLFGNKKRNIYPTLIKAEYNNRLWYKVWFGEWYQASKMVEKMAKDQNKFGSFNPVLLANNQTNGYIRVGTASKLGKSKKLVKLFTIGVPLFFTRFIYYEKLPKNFNYKLILKDEINKKLGKRNK